MTSDKPCKSGFPGLKCRKFPADHWGMNGPRSTLESSQPRLDRDIWSIDESSPAEMAEAIPSTLHEAARRLQEALIRCGCLEKNGVPSWTRASPKTPARWH